MYKCLILNADNGALIKRSVGAYRIATVLREQGWDAEVIDFATHWSFDELKALALSRIDSDFKFIGISAFYYSTRLPNFELFIEWIKKEYPHLKIITGGPHRFKFNNPNIDYNLNGYGENAMFVLLKYLFSNGPMPRFSMHFNSGRNIPANEYYPAYPMKSLMVKYEDRDFIDKNEWLGVEFARGCMFSCAFCNFPVLGVKGDYTRDADDFRIQIMDAYDKFGVTNYYVADETFNDRTEKITKFADVVDTLPFDPYFTGFIRADLLVSRPTDKEELLRMGFLGQFYGIESFSPKTGKAIGKGMNPDKLKQGLIDIKTFFEANANNKFRGSISLIAGLPHETKESLYETLAWLPENWQGHAFSMYPLEIPNSEFYNPSKISMDYSKYGYRDAKLDPDILEYSEHRSAMDIDHTDIMLWKNEYMSIREADEISKNAETLKKLYNFRQNSFALLRTGLGTLEERLETLERDPLPDPIDFIKNYINKKLGL
jgi:radical SAM superfamily enzyme YgiQ (UPF0313 family)